MKKSWILLIPVFLLMISGCVSFPPLHEASSEGDIKRMQTLLDEGKDINEWFYGTPLMSAVGSNKLDAVKFLVERGATIDVGNKIGHTALGSGAYMGYIDIVKYLIIKGADINYAVDGLEKWKAYCSQRPVVMKCIKKATDGIALLKRIMFEIGVDSYRNGEYQKALEAFKKAIEDNPSNPAYYTWLSATYRLLQQYDEAITAAKRAIELLKPNNDSGYYSNLGHAYGMKKQYDEAIKALKKAIEIDPKMSNAYYWMGRFLIEQNAYNEAVEAYKKGIEAAPSNPDLRESLAIAYYRMGRYDDAIVAANKAIELQTFTGIGINSSIKGGYTVVEGVMEAGPAKKAGIQIGDKIIRIDGKSTKGWNLEQVVQSLRGASGTQVSIKIERKGAEKTIDKTVTRETIITKEAALSFGLRSLAYRYKGSLEAALTDAEKAYSLDSANDWARVSLGAAYLDKDKYEESIKVLSQVKYSLSARILEATAYAKQGKMKLAVNIYLSIMDAYPEEAISYLRRTSR